MSQSVNMNDAWGVMQTESHADDQDKYITRIPRKQSEPNDLHQEHKNLQTDHTQIIYLLQHIMQENRSRRQTQEHRNNVMYVLVGIGLVLLVYYIDRLHNQMKFMNAYMTRSHFLPM